MIGVPMPNPRDSIISNLNQQMDHYFGAGRSVQQIAAGVSGEKEGPISSTRSNKLRVERDKIAPRLKALAEAGTPVAKAAKECGMEAKRARLIARENGFKFKS
ncbi:hypothetical protein [Pseudomonas brassicacearum]|uniref:Uncharacterized protein n=1 Tax=Pseudomonas brassicacearum TaxID=930166 RepID=A0A423JPG1_9PSED|nr:hypothetical protein [Pseudomonas brassicacearum]RON39555.1 hypothetical protein BK664_11375 [Pseudomonas brassicacearum]